MKLSEIKWHVKLRIRLKKLFHIKLTQWETYVYNYMTEPLYSMLFSDDLMTEEQLLKNERMEREEKERKVKLSQIPEELTDTLEREKVKNEGPLFTLYTCGPWLLTYKFPVAAKFLVKEIVNENGKIGPEKYKAIPGALEALKDYNNEFFRENDAASELLQQDVLILCRDYGYDDAYTIGASIVTSYDEHKKLMQLAAEHGVKEGMVSFGICLYRDHEVEEGRCWVERGASLGCTLGMAMIGVSYQFGTITKIDYNKAAYWYKRYLEELEAEKKKGEETDREVDEWTVYVVSNLGSLYADAGCFHTARKYFQMAVEYGESCKDRLRFTSNLSLLQNLSSCDEILKFPFPERRCHAVIQRHAAALDSIFCSSPSGESVAPKPVFNPAVDRIVLFSPSDDELEPVDLDEKYRLENQQDESEGGVRFPYDSFVFPVHKVAIRNSAVADYRKELIFLERNVHAELNGYIQAHFEDIKDLFKKNDFYFVYLPAHAVDHQDDNDIMISSLDSKEQNPLFGRTRFWRDRRKESLYWDSFFSEEDLPEDCAGFLQPLPDDDGPGGRAYRYIVFPHRPGTDWGRAFNAFMAFLTGKPTEEVSGKKLLDVSTKIRIDMHFDVTVVDGSGTTVGEVKMPALSKVLFFAFLRHPEGIAIKELVDHRDELLSCYRAVSVKRVNEKSIDDLVDPTKNSANEKISRIRKAFEDALGHYDCDISSMVPAGRKGEKYVIRFDRSNVEWESELPL